MSHTTKVKSVVIRDVRAIRAAVQELQRAGRKIALKENAVPRMYYKDQFQNSTKRQTAEYVIECQGMSNITGKPCDVGLVKQDDGTFVPYLDTWGTTSKSIAETRSLLPKMALRNRILPLRLSPRRIPSTRPFSRQPTRATPCRTATLIPRAMCS